MYLCVDMAVVSCFNKSVTSLVSTIDTHYSHTVIGCTAANYLSVCLFFIAGSYSNRVKKIEMCSFKGKS